MESERNGQVLRYNGYVAGWLDSSIHDFLEVFHTSKTTAFALITCLDSERSPKSLASTSTDLQAVMDLAKPVGQGVLLPAKQLQAPAFRDRVFHGFDEIWFFPTNQIAPKPDSAWIVGPKRIDQATLDKLGEWMTKNGCSLAIGDGDGLNVIVKAQGLVGRLIAHSMAQPEPISAMSSLLKEDTGEP
ncbi:MAG TPA: hypothetical protein VMV69_16545 [Pirellulales bacterium]|nr:hypothetical protein [Pirellulales bacterium]